MHRPEAAPHAPATRRAWWAVRAFARLGLPLLATLLLLVQPGLHLNHSGLTLASALSTPTGAGHAHHDAACHDTTPETRGHVPTSDHAATHDCTCCLPTTPDLPRAVTLPSVAWPRAPTTREDRVHTRAVTVPATARGPPPSLTTA